MEDRILIVDDEEMICGMVSRRLTQKGYSCVTAHNGREALEKKRLEEDLEVYHKNLEKLVEERTVKLQQAYRTLKKAYLDSVKVLAEAVDAEAPYTRGHSDRVRRMSLRIARCPSFQRWTFQGPILRP